MPPARAVAEPVVLGWRCLLWLPVVQLVAVCSACVVGHSQGLRGPSSGFCCGLVPVCVWTGGDGRVQGRSSILVCFGVWRRNFLDVFGSSAMAPCHQLSVSLGPTWTSSFQQSSLHTISSCGLNGKGSGGARQQACHTMLHRVHSVSTPPWSQASHWSFRSPSQCRFGTQSRATICCVGARGCVCWWSVVLRTLCLPVLHARLSTSGVGVGLFLPLLAGGVWVVRGGEEGGLVCARSPWLS